MATVAAEESLLFPESLGGPDGERGPCPPAALLLIVGEPFTIDQKDLILERIVTELSSWDCELAKCDVDEQLGAFAQQQPKAREGPNGEKIFRLESAQLRATVLVNASVQTVKAHIRSFLATPSTYLHLLHSGLALQGSGTWILQDGTFSFSNLSELFYQQVQSKSGPGATLDVSVLNEGPEWKEETFKRLAGRLKIRLNPPKTQRREEDGVVRFTDVLSVSLKAPSSVELLPATDIVGSISFQRPTMYVFPAGAGDSAFFGVNGFNLVVNGGFGRRACFWQLVRHLIRIDAVLVSHVGPENVFGISSFFERKAAEKTSPDVGLVYLNIGDAKPAALPVSSGLLVSLADEGANILDHLRHIGMKVSACAGSVAGHALQPINLYFNVGRGSLDLYVLSPLEGKELKDFVGNWSRHVNGSNAKTGVPLADEFSVCSLLVWKPACPKEKTIRILFPGNAPQSKIFEGIERLKGVALFQSAGAEKAADKMVPDKKASDKKVPDRKGVVPPTAEADHKRSSGATSEHKSSAGDQRDSKKPTDQQHRDAKHSSENRAPGKVESESKGKTEHKEQRTVASAKKIEGKQGTGKPETGTKKAELKADQKEAKSLAKHEPEVRKEGRHAVEPKDASKKASDVEQKDSKRVSAATRSIAPETKEPKSPAAKQDSTPVKVGSKVAEKAAKDAKNKKVVKETQDAKTPKKKETAPKDSPAAASAGKRQKRDATAIGVNGQRAADDLVPPASVERPKVTLELNSEQISSKQQAVGETEDVGRVPDAEVNASKSQESEKSTELSEATDASVVKDKEPTRADAEAELVVSSPELPPQIEELNTIVEDQSEPDVIVSASLVAEEPGLASDHAVSEKEIGFQSVSQLEEPASSVRDTEPADKSGSMLNQTVPGELDETKAAVKEALEKLQLLVDQPVLEEDVVKKPETHSTTEGVIEMPEDHSSKEVTEESGPAADHPAVEEALEKLQLLVDQPVLEEDAVKKPETHSTTEGVIEMPEDHSGKGATEESGPAVGHPAVEEALEKPQLLVEQPVLEEDVVKKPETHSATEGVAEATTGKPASDNSVPKEAMEKMEALEEHLSTKEILETVDPASGHPTAEDGSKKPEPSVKHPDHEEGIEKSEGHLGDSVPQEDVIKKLEDSLALKEEVAVPEPKLDDSVHQEVIERSESLVEHTTEKGVVETADPALGQVGSEGEVEKLEPHLDHHDSEDVIKKPEDHDAAKEAMQLSDPDEEIINKTEPNEDHSTPKDVVEALDKSSKYPVSEELIIGPEKPIEHPIPETDANKVSEEQPATEEVIKVVEASGPALALQVSKEVVEKPEPVIDQDHHGSGDKVTGEVLTRSLPDEDIAVKPNQIPSLVQPDANESSEVPAIVKSVEIKSGDLNENLAATPVKEPFEIHDTFDDDVLISPDEPSQDSLVEKDLLERLEKEETVEGVDAFSGKQDSEIVEKQKEKSVEEIPAKTLHAEGHSTSLEKNLPEVSEDSGVKETGKHLPDAGKQGKAEAKEDADYPGAGDEEGDLIPVKTGVEQLDATKEESFVEGDKSSDEVNLSAASEASFDPEKSWGQPEGLPAPMNRKKDGDGDRGNHASSTAGGKKPASQPNASGKKSDGAENLAGARRSTAAAKVERPGDEGAKLPAGRGGIGAQKKKPPPAESSTRTPHPSDVKKTASKPPVVPFYVDLAYVPSHGDTDRFDGDFFRSVRAQYYVLSSSDPDPRVLGLLLDAKEDSWGAATRAGDEAANTTVIPTYDSARLMAWATENRDRLSRLRVAVAVSANRHTMQLQEHDAICQAYRLEF